ncbi:MAG: hypothetical protein RL026_1804 [Pseudomonadota bacterium]
MSGPRHDVVVVGGGPVGACLASLLVHAGFAAERIALLEPAVPAAPLPGEAFDPRVSAWSPASRELLQRCGAWSRIDPRRISPYERMCVWHEGGAPDRDDALRFDASGVGEPDLGAIIENRAVQVALLGSFVAAGGVLHRASATGVQWQRDRVQLRVHDAAGVSGVLEASLVVAADGALSPLRGWVGIEVNRQPYGEQAIVATVRPQHAHQRTAWQVFLGTGPLALLPLADGDCSIVWSATDARSRQLQALGDAAFEAALLRASGGVLGALRLQGPRRAYPLQRLVATRYVAERCALVGDAAHVIHPLAGQGANQGLQDVATLARVLATRPAREDVGAPHLLRAYERERKAGNALMGWLVDALDRGFAEDAGPGGRVVREGFSWVARRPWLVGQLARQALGR